MKNKEYNTTTEDVDNNIPSNLRRQLLKSTWAAPVVATVALPKHAQATTPPVAGLCEFSFAEGDGPVDIVIPDDVTEITYTAEGAPGGDGGNEETELWTQDIEAGTSESTGEVNFAAGGVGGAGVIVSGTVAVTPGSTLTIHVGGPGGKGSDSYFHATCAPNCPGNTGDALGGPGGTGYFAGGMGGASVATEAPIQAATGGGGGGGGSGILENGTPIVVAGGGGGGGGANNGFIIGGDGGDGGMDGTDSSATPVPNGGIAGAGGVGGMGGASGGTNVPTPGDTGGTETGGNGGGTSSPQEGQTGQYGGGGGGGYGGGGGGGGNWGGAHGGGGGGGGGNLGEVVGPGSGTPMVSLSFETAAECPVAG